MSRAQTTKKASQRKRALGAYLRDGKKGAVIAAFYHDNPKGTGPSLCLHGFVLGIKNAKRLHQWLERHLESL